MKIKNKGKVHPSPSSSSSSSSTMSTATAFVLDGERDVFSVLKLLPAAILALASVLSLDDREVLAYMIARSIKTTTNPSSFLHDSKKKPTRKQQSNNNNSGGGHNSGSHKAGGGAVFDCDCFDCYTSYWFRWDSSPNRELIHQAIEAFDDHLTNGERTRKNARGAKRRDKTARRLREKQVAEPEMPSPETEEPFVVDDASVSVSPDDDASPVSTPASADDGEINEVVAEMIEEAAAAEEIVGDEQVVKIEERSLVVRSPVPVCSSNHKGLARKVLPDVMGLLNSRLWSLWSPNV